MRVQVSAKNIFLIVSFLLTLLVGFFSYLLIKTQLHDYLYLNYQESLGSHIDSLAHEHFDLDSNRTLKQSGDPKNFIISLAQHAEIKSLQLTDANGTIISSTNTPDVGLSLLGEKNWQSAISGLITLGNLNRPEKSITVYFPLISGDNITRGVVKVIAEIPESLKSVEKFTVYITLTIIGIVSVFVLIAYIIMWELESDMEAKERSIFDQSKAQTEEKKLYEAITTSLAEALIVINKNSQIMFINPEAEKMISRKSSEVEYRSYEKIITFYTADGKKISHSPIAESLKKGSTIHIVSKDNYHIKQGKTLIPVSINVAPVANDKSYIKGVAVTINDISSEKELQKVKDEFVYVVAHELGNPIFALDGYLTLIQDRNKKSDKQTKELIENARSIDSQLSGLVNDLLEVARNETGRLNCELGRIKIENIAEEVVKNSQFKAKDKKIKLYLSYSNIPEVIGNDQKIKEVITNLIDNAIKYTRENGAVHAEIFKHEERVVFSVKDNGLGISKEAQTRLFEKFYRVKNKDTESISGTGLGLFIAKQIVEKCGGEIWAASEEGKGSTFSFDLKVAK